MAALRTPRRSGRRGGRARLAGGWRALRLRGAFAAALAGGALTWGGGLYLVERAVADEAGTRADAIRPRLEGLAGRLAADLRAGEAQAAVRRLEQATASPEGTRAHVVDPTGEVLAAAGPVATVRRWRPGSPAETTGRLDGARYLELRAPVRADGDDVGLLRVQVPLRTPAWAAEVPRVAGIVAAVAGLLACVYLGFALRGTRGILRVLERAEAGDYYQRAPLVGCGELRAVATRLHATMEAFVREGKSAEDVYLETALALCKTIEAKDRYTSGHSQRVAVYAEEMGRALHFDEVRLHTLVVGAKLHDIGKVAVSDAVLLKPGPLDDEEFEAMKKHPLAGDRILSALPGMRDMADIARSHHEKWDGSGYPYGARGDAIPLEGRIVAIADAYDALVTKRSYKPAMPVEKALAIIEKDAGTHFDPELARLFVSMKRNGQGYKALKPDGAVPARPEGGDGGRAAGDGGTERSAARAASPSR